MLGKFFKKIKDVAADLSPFAGVAASAFGLGPLYSTLIGAGVPLLAGKGGREALAGGVGGYFGGQTFGQNTLKDVITDEAVRKAAAERFKKAAIFESLGENNPLRNLPGVLGGSTFLYGLGAFDTDQAPSNLIEDFTYNPADNKLITSGVSDKFLEDAQQANIIGDNPGDIYEFLRKVGLLNSDGNRMTFDDGKGTVMGMTPQTLSRMPTTEETIASANRMAALEGSEEYEAYMKRLIEEQIKKGKPKPDTFVSDRAGKGNFAMGGGIGAFADPNVVGGDRINPTGGRLVGMGSGRQDLLEGEIVDPNTGQTQEILVSNNEHVIPEYTLFALGGGDTEKGQKMMDNLRAETKPMAKEMGYDFAGAEDGSMNYAPLVAQDGIDSGILGESANTISDLNKQLMFIQKGIENEQRIFEMTRDQKSADKLKQLQAQQKSLLDRLGITKDDLARINMVMQDGRQTAMVGPGMNLQEIIKKMMAQGKSIEEIMAIMSKLNMGMPKQRLPMTAQDGRGTQSIGAMLEEMIKKPRMQDMKTEDPPLGDLKPKTPPSLPPMSNEDMKRRFVMQEFGVNPMDDAMMKFFMSDPSGFTKMFGVEEADKIRKKMRMKTQKQMEDEGAVFRRDSAEIIGYNIADGIGTNKVNGLKKMGLQEGAGTEFLKAGLGKMVRDLDQANQIASQI